VAVARLTQVRVDQPGPPAQGHQPGLAGLLDGPPLDALDALGGQSLQQRGRVAGRAAQAATGDEQRSQRGGAHVVGHGRGGSTRGTRARVEHSPKLRVHADLRQLAVGHHQRAQTLAAGIELGGQDLDQAGGLGRRGGQQAVDLPCPAAHAPAGELPPELRQGGTHRLQALVRGGRGVGGQTAQHVVLQQH